MIRHAIWTLGLALTLAGCGWLKQGPPNPDGLAKWGATHGVFPQDPAKIVVTPDAGGFRKTADGHGYEALPATGQKADPTRRYFVPLDQLDAKLAADIRQELFPAGIATFAPKQEGQPKRTVALSELDTLYVQLSVLPVDALCDDLAKPCDAASEVALVGKLKRAPLFGKGARAILITPIVATDTLIGSEVPDAQTLCGFDPVRDRVPTHVAEGCLNLRRLQWAGPHGFTLRPMGQALPLTETALKQWLRGLADGPLKQSGGEIGNLFEGN